MYEPPHCFDNPEENKKYEYWTIFVCDVQGEETYRSVHWHWTKPEELPDGFTISTLAEDYHRAYCNWFRALTMRDFYRTALLEAISIHLGEPTVGETVVLRINGRRHIIQAEKEKDAIRWSMIAEEPIKIVEIAP